MLLMDFPAISLTFTTESRAGSVSLHRAVQGQRMAALVGSGAAIAGEEAVPVSESSITTCMCGYQR